MNDKDNDIRNELSFTLGSLGERLRGVATEVQNKIRANQTNVQENVDYLASIRDTVEKNSRMAKGEIPIPETPVAVERKVSDVPFIDNHLKENPDSMKSVKQMTQNQAAPKKAQPEGPPPQLLDKKKVRGLDETLRQRVFGQDETVTEVVDILKVAALKIKVNAKKPAGCYFFAGPSGVGKTELAQSIADQLGVPLLKLNGGEYGLEHEVSKLIGAPPGYSGSDQDGVLTGFVKEKKACVVLIDEIEKAHSSIDKILLSIMDHGECGTNKPTVNADGSASFETVPFTETIVIATSNLGAEVEYIPGENFLHDKKALETYGATYKEQHNSKATEEEIEKHFIQSQKNELRMEYIKEGVRPEIINRYDSIFHFNSLSPEIYGKVANKFLKQLTDTIKKEHNFDLKFSDKLVEWMVNKSYDPAMGGRPARKFIEKIVIKPLADYMLEDNFETAIKEHPELTMDLNKNGNVCFKGKNKKILGVLENTEELVSRIQVGKFSKSPKM